MRYTFVKVSAYVPCYNARTTLPAVLRSIINQSLSLGEISVVDDGSTDGSADVSRVRIISLDRNKGSCAARARAMMEAVNDLVLGCDATMVLDGSFLEKALPCFEDDQIAAVFGRIYGGCALTVAHRWRERHLFQSPMTFPVRRYAALASGCSLKRKSARGRVGGFNTNLRAGEDAGLGKRLLAAGFDVIFDPKLKATSLLSNSTIQVQERYGRWNASSRISAQGYLRQLNYAIKIMMVKDPKQRIHWPHILVLCHHTTNS
jgi:glycosyltransferase involved in cell wall biosynthesis